MLILDNMKSYQSFMGITNAQIARNLKLQPMAVSRFFNGDNPKYEDLLMYSKYFGMNLSFFESADFDPAVILPVETVVNEEDIYYSGSLSSHEEDVLETVGKVVELFKHLNILIMDHEMRL